MKKVLLLLLFLNMLNICMGQDIVLIGRMEDLKTGQPLSYATIEITSLKTGTITDKEGNFNLCIILHDMNLDTILFSHVGYEKKKMSVNDFINSEKIIALKEKPVMLGEINVFPKNILPEYLV